MADEYKKVRYYCNQFLTNLPSYNTLVESNSSSDYEHKFYFIDLSNFQGKDKTKINTKFANNFITNMAFIINEHISKDINRNKNGAFDIKKSYFCFQFFTKKIAVSYIPNLLLNHYDSIVPDVIDQIFQIDNSIKDLIENEKILIDITLNYSDYYKVDEQEYVKINYFKKSLSYLPDKEDFDILEYNNEAETDSQKLPDHVPLSIEKINKINEFCIKKSNDGKMTDKGKEYHHTMENYDDVSLLKRYCYLKYYFTKEKLSINADFYIFSGDTFGIKIYGGHFQELEFMFQKADKNNFDDLYYYIELVEDNKITFDKFDIERILGKCSSMPYMERSTSYELVKKEGKIFINPYFGKEISESTTTYINHFPIIDDDVREHIYNKDFFKKVY